MTSMEYGIWLVRLRQLESSGFFPVFGTWVMRALSRRALVHTHARARLAPQIFTRSRVFSQRARHNNSIIRHQACNGMIQSKPR